MGVSLRAKTVTLALLVFLSLAFFYFIIYSGTADPLLLRIINKRIPLSLKWRERTLLNFRGLEVRQDARYFYAPELRINFQPRLGGPGWATAILAFENGYISQGKKIVIKNVAAQIPLEISWPYKIYPLGQGYLKSDEVKMDRFTVLNPKTELLMTPAVILARDLDMGIWQSPVSVRGKADLEKKYFTLSSHFDKIEMEVLASDINIKKFGGRGRWSGNLKLKYSQAEGLEGNGGFKLLPPGGDIKTVFLKELILNMPEAEPRKKLLQGLGEGEYFDLSEGEMDCHITSKNIKIKVFLKGQKGLFDLAINLPTSLVERFLKRMGEIRL